MVVDAGVQAIEILEENHVVATEEQSARLRTSNSAVGEITALNHFVGHLLVAVRRTARGLKALTGELIYLLLGFPRKVIHRRLAASEPITGGRQWSQITRSATGEEETEAGEIKACATLRDVL